MFEYVAQRSAEHDHGIVGFVVEAGEVAQVELLPVLDAGGEPAGVAELAVACELGGGQVADDDAAAEPVQDFGEPPGPGADLEDATAAGDGAFDGLGVKHEGDPVTEAALPSIPLGVAELVIVAATRAASYDTTVSSR